MSSLREKIEHRKDIRRSALWPESAKTLAASSRYPSLPQLSHLPEFSHGHTLPKHFGRDFTFGSTLHLADAFQPPAYVRPAHSSLPHEGFSARNQEWSSVQTAIVSLFQQKKLSNVEMTLLCENVRAISRSELGPFIYDYYKNQLMTRGLRILRDKVELIAKEQDDLLTSLGEVWDIFYKEILPLLQLVLRPIQVKDHNIRNITLLGFRDTVVLKIDIEDALDQCQGNVPPAIQQMLLVLQSVKGSVPPDEQYLRLESLVARVVHPYLGYCGLYTHGNPEPEIKSKHPVVVMRNKLEANRTWVSQSALFPSTQEALAKIRNVMVPTHTRLPSSSALSETPALEPVLETIEKAKNPIHEELRRKVSDSRRHSMSEISG